MCSHWKPRIYFFAVCICRSCRATKSRVFADSLLIFAKAGTRHPNSQCCIFFLLVSDKLSEIFLSGLQRRGFGSSIMMSSSEVEDCAALVCRNNNVIGLQAGWFQRLAPPPSLGILLNQVVSLDLSRNALRSLAGVEALVHVCELNVYFNDLSDTRDVTWLGPHLRYLRKLDTRLNPCQAGLHYHRVVTAAFPSLEVLDAKPVQRPSLSVPSRESDALADGVWFPERCAAQEFADADVEATLVFADGRRRSCSLQVHVLPPQASARVPVSIATTCGRGEACSSTAHPDRHRPSRGDPSCAAGRASSICSEPATGLGRPASARTVASGRSSNSGSTLSLHAAEVRPSSDASRPARCSHVACSTAIGRGDGGAASSLRHLGSRAGPAEPSSASPCACRGDLPVASDGMLQPVAWWHVSPSSPASSCSGGSPCTVPQQAAGAGSAWMAAPVPLREEAAAALARLRAAAREKAAARMAAAARSAGGVRAPAERAAVPVAASGCAQETVEWKVSRAPAASVPAALPNTAAAGQPRPAATLFPAVLTMLHGEGGGTSGAQHPLPQRAAVAGLVARRLEGRPAGSSSEARPASAAIPHSAVLRTWPPGSAQRREIAAMGEIRGGADDPLPAPACSSRHSSRMAERRAALAALLDSPHKPAAAEATATGQACAVGRHGLPRAQTDVQGAPGPRDEWLPAGSRSSSPSLNRHPLCDLGPRAQAGAHTIPAAAAAAASSCGASNTGGLPAAASFKHRVAAATAAASRSLRSRPQPAAAAAVRPPPLPAAASAAPDADHAGHAPHRRADRRRSIDTGASPVLRGASETAGTPAYVPAAAAAAHGRGAEQPGNTTQTGVNTARLGSSAAAATHATNSRGADADGGRSAPAARRAHVQRQRGEQAITPLKAAAPPAPALSARSKHSRTAAVQTLAAHGSLPVASSAFIRAVDVSIEREASGAAAEAPTRGVSRATPPAPTQPTPAAIGTAQAGAATCGSADGALSTGGAGNDPWRVFASAQMQTLTLLRDSYSRLLTASDSVRAEAAGLRTQLVRATAEHAEEAQSLRREIATAQAELASRLTRIEQLESELAAALHQKAAVDHGRAEAVTARDAATAALAEMRANHLEQLKRWRELFLQLRDQFTELTQPPPSPGSPRSSAAPSPAAPPC